MPVSLFPSRFMWRSSSLTLWLVINQLDTTQSHLGPKPASAKADFSKEELSAILKFGAQNM